MANNKKQDPIGPRLRAEAEAAAIKEASTTGKVASTVADDVVTTPRAMTVPVTVVMEDGTRLNYEHRCDNGGNYCKLWKV